MAASRVASFRLPRELIARLRRSVPKGSQSAFVARAVTRELDMQVDDVLPVEVTPTSIEAYRRGFVSGVTRGASLRPNEILDPEHVEDLVERELDARVLTADGIPPDRDDD